MFQLCNQALTSEQYRDELIDESCGALVIFEGRVRNHNDGRKVALLQYEAYDVLAVREGNRILAEAVEKFDVFRCSCYHRTGRLNVGDPAVWVGVAAPHRQAAFKACQFIIDDVKTQVPIWKKETYSDGESEWVNCRNCSHPR